MVTLPNFIYGVNTMAKVSRSGTAGRFYCPGCRAFHSFEVTGELDVNNPTVPSRLMYANGGGQVVCVGIIRDGRITYTMESLHGLMGQTVDLPYIAGGVPK